MLWIDDMCVWLGLRSNNENMDVLPTTMGGNRWLEMMISVVQERYVRRLLL